MQYSDFNTPEFFAEPYPTYRRLREAGPLIGVAPGIWATGHHAIIDTLLKDRRMGKNYPGAIERRYGAERMAEPIFATLAKSVLMVNPPEHTRLRTLLNKVFTPEKIRTFRAAARRVCDELVDSFVEQGAADLARDFNHPLPISIICSIMDLPAADSKFLAEAVSSFAQALEVAPMTAAQVDRASEGIRQLQGYFEPIMAARRGKDADDVISQLLQAEDAGDRLTHDEVMCNIILLYIAGHETTTNAIGNGLIALHQHPDELARVKVDPALIPDMIVESLRYDSSVQAGSRSALEAMEIEGVQVRQGEAVFMFLGAANRDPARYQDPDRFIIGRADQDRRILAFGGGIHYCLGARLAQIELEEAFATLLSRLPDLQLTELDRPDWYQRSVLRGVHSLPATWSA